MSPKAIIGMDKARRFCATAALAVRGRVESHVPFRSERTIRRRQTRNLRRIVAHALGTVPFYQDVARSGKVSEQDVLTCEDLSRFPLIDGTSLHRDPIRFVSTAFPLQSLVKLYSTGTAAYGAKTVYWHPQQLMAQAAYGERGRRVLRRLLGVSGGLVRLSFFHPDSASPVASRFRASRLLIPRWAMRTEWASCELPYDKVARCLDSVRPHVVYSYGSFAESFLLHVYDRGWDVRLPKVWVFGGDGVSPEGRRKIEQDLGCTLYSTYQSVEAGTIGFECEERSGYHINIDLCHVRLVNERGEAVEPGEVGEVVISSLLNHGTILLNYRLGDQAAWSPDPCSCGRKLPLLRLTGSRTGSLLRLRDGRKLHDHVLLHACQESMQDVLQYQIVERAPESIVWRVVVAQDADRKEIADALTERSLSVMSPEATIDVEFADRIVLPAGSKLTRVVRPSADSKYA